jgi:SPFH domain / Band 7 family
MWNWVIANRDWLFSGVGVVGLLGLLRLAVWLPRRMNQRACAPPDPATSAHEAGRSSGPPSTVTDHWQGIRPPNSRFKTVTESVDSIPGGLQLVSLEFGPQGHANSLTLKDAIVRAEIQFTCCIEDAYKVMFGANEYALNVLPPRFLVHARNILEGLTLARLRSRRLQVAREIVAQLSPMFEELGVRLESVTIGAIDELRPISRDSAAAKKSK